MITVNVIMVQSFCYVLSCATKCVIFSLFSLCISVTGFDWFILKRKTKQNGPLIFFNNCISAQVIHYSLQPCLCNLTSKCWQSKACTCNNERSILYYYSIKMCMNLSALLFLADYITEVHTRARICYSLSLWTREDHLYKGRRTCFTS